MSVQILLADSVTALTARHAGQVIVTGSHGGMIAARYAALAAVRAVVFNDAARGRDDAGIAGLAALARVRIPAIAVTHFSARIGDAADTLVNGVTGLCNEPAAALEVVAGMACSAAVQRLCMSAWHTGEITVTQAQSRTCLLGREGSLAPVHALDSVGLVEPSDARAVLIVGSHGALHGGDPATALPVAARGAIFHDAGRGKDDAGTSRLPILDQHGIAAATVDYRTARIGDARSMWDTGLLSVANATAVARGVSVGMSARAAAKILRQ